MFDTSTIRKRLPSSLSSGSIVSFFISLALCGFLVYTIITSRQNIEKLEIEHLILEKGIRLNDEISRLMYKTQTLSVLVIQGNGDVANFNEAAAAMVANESLILNVLLAPDGIAKKVYPLYNNEAVIGWDYFSDAPGNKEAQIAKELGALVMGGPIERTQGGQALVGRLPVYLDARDEKYKFWGFVSVAVKFPDALESLKLTTLKDRGFYYELWRINPDDGKKQILSENLEFTKPGSHFVEGKIIICNAEWYLKLWPTQAWYKSSENLILIIVGLFISFLVLVVVQNNHELRKMKSFFEKMAHADPLTGLFNRRYMDENLKRIISSLSRSNGMLSLLMIDIDLFKNYNDTYGHNRGDVCLKLIAQILKSHLLRNEDFVARYGGEEFTVVLPNTDEKGAITISERLIESVRHHKIPHESSSVASHVTISIGITSAAVQHTHTGDDYVKQADKALYMSKQGGRDRCTFLDL